MRVWTSSFLFLVFGFLLGVLSSFYLGDWFVPLVAGGFLVGFYWTLLGVLFFGLSIPSVFRRLVESFVLFLYFAVVVAYPPILLAAFMPALFATFYPMYLAVRHEIFSIWRLLAWIVLTSISMQAVQYVIQPTEENFFLIGYTTATAFGLLYRQLLAPRRRGY